MVFKLWQARNPKVFGHCYQVTGSNVSEQMEQGAVWLLFSFYHDPLRSSYKNCW